MTNAVRALFNHSAAIQKLYYECIGNESNIVGIQLKWDVLYMEFLNTPELPWQFLEPVAEYCIKKGVTWKIKTQNQNFCIQLSTNN